MESGQPSLAFIWPECGSTISETIEEVPSYDALADRESDAKGHAEQTVGCPGCAHEFTVNIRNIGAWWLQYFDPISLVHHTAYDRRRP
jgi:hypothetical protein